MANETNDTATPGRKVHADWPETVRDMWDNNAPTVDLMYALKVARHYDVAASGSVPRETELTIDDIKRVVEYSVSYNGADWAASTDRYGGSELQMVVLAELVDGCWAAITAWNDYTGWGCQDEADVRVAASREDAMRYGFSDEDRAVLAAVSA